MGPPLSHGSGSMDRHGPTHLPPTQSGDPKTLPVGLEHSLAPSLSKGHTPLNIGQSRT